MLHEDCIIVLLTRIEREDCPELEWSTVSTVRQMEDSYELAVTKEDIEKYLNYCRVSSELGEI